jgi:tetratricopeptide (TPR) repeat protein
LYSRAAKSVSISHRRGGAILGAGVTFSHSSMKSSFSAASLAFTILCLLAPPAPAQSKKKPQPPPVVGATINGHVRDAKGNPSAYATVYLDHATEVSAGNANPTPITETEKVQSSSQGAYSFAGLGEGSYAVRAQATSGERSSRSAVTLSRNESKTIDLIIESSDSDADSTAESDSHSNPAPEFFDQPQFTVAGVAPASNSGGHGSDTVVRTSEALVKATGELSKDATTPDRATTAPKSDVGEKLQRQRKDLLVQIQPNETLSDAASRAVQADRLHTLALIDEQLGNPLDAVHELQQAAALDPSETNLFDWGTELLTHRALEPATEVFRQGIEHYPQSARMHIALGVTWYARGSYDEAAQSLARASDLAPSNPAPYIFMGRMQTGEVIPSRQIVDHLALFSRLAPDNALANYYYAVALWKTKKAANALDEVSLSQIESLLAKAAQIDPQLGPAQLQLGVLYAQRGDYRRAIAAYKKAIEANPELEEAHYRLGLAYRHIGNDAGAQEQMKLHEQLSAQSKAQAERERREIQEFVVSLRK